MPPHKATKYITLNGRFVHIHKLKRNNCVVLIYTLSLKKGKIISSLMANSGALKNCQNYGKLTPMLPSDGKGEGGNRMS